MFITIRDNMVGVVEDGIIVEAYDKKETINDIYNKDATPVDSEIVGNKPLSDNMARINCNNRTCKMNHNIGETEHVDPSQSIDKVLIDKYI